MTRNEYRAPNPEDLTTFVKVRVQRSPDNLAWTDVGVFPVDTSNESTTVVDLAGTLTSYYRHRHEDIALNITAPTAPTAAAAAGTTLGIGTYRYKISFVNVSGESAGGTEQTVVTTVNNQAVALTAIPVGGAGVTKRRIYRTIVGGAADTEKFVATIENNTSTTYTDIIPDASLGVAVLGAVTDYSDGILFGDYWVLQQIKHDIPDADMATGDWNSWRDQTFIDMQSFGLGRAADVQDFLPASSTDYNVALRGDIRRVDRVEIWRTIQGEYWTWITAWEQRGRKIRIMFPKVNYTYKIYGTAELRDLNDLDDDLWNILYWGMRWRYLLFRGEERIDMRPFLARTRQSDTTTQSDFKRLADDAKLQFDQAVARVLLNAGVPSGGIA